MSGRSVVRSRAAALATSLFLLAVVVASSSPARATVVMEGQRDATGATAPRWAATVYTAPESGEATITLDWDGDGNLGIAIRDAATSQWLASDTSDARPKELTLDLEAGTGYRIAVWALSGVGTFTVDITMSDPPPTTTTTAPPPGEVVACGMSNGYDLCLHAESAVLSGHAEIWVTFNGAADVFALEYAWGASPDATDDLLTDFHAPWIWEWPTHRYLDGTGYLIVRAEKPAGTTGAPIAVPVTLENGNTTTVPQNPNDWDTLFTPRPQAGADPVIAAVGDGGDGGETSFEVAAYLHQSEAEAVLFLGDMYERGTPAEWEVNYGLASFDDPGGGTGWGVMAGYTQPTLGNHEAWHVDVWRDYWHGRPDWDAFSYGGTLFLNLNSECSLVGGCDPGSPQYEFAADTLAAATESCIVAMWHRPVLSAVYNTEAMEPLWQLVAENGGDLVLTGHTHDMEMTAPLNGSLQAGQADSHMVQLVAGSGGHNMVSALATDPRTTWQATKVPGAVFLTLVGGDSGRATAIEWEFRDVSGAAVVSGAPGVGTVDCGAAQEPDTAPPTVPGTPSGTSTVPGTIDLTWMAATDDRATTIDYLIYRDGEPSPIAMIASASTTTVTFTDTGLAEGSVHTYTVAASDGVNQSAPSAASDPITVAESGGTDPLVFSDTFDAGLGSWDTVAGASLDATAGAAAPPSALVDAVTSQGYLRTSLPVDLDAACVSTAIRIDTQASNVSLVRFRSDDSGIARVYRRANGQLWFRSDASGANARADASMPSGTWVTIELCADVAAGELTLAVDGVLASSWSADLGSTPISVLQLGDNAAKTWRAHYDDVHVVRAE